MTIASQPPEHDPRTALRASDADRETVAERLREAAGDGRIDLVELDERLDRVFAAKTYGELEPLTADLPEALAQAQAEADRDQPPLVIKGGAAGDSRKGHWVVPPTIVVHGGIGGVKLDFTRAELRRPIIEMDVRGEIGGVKLVVPESWRVELVRSEAGMGGVKNKANAVPTPAAPLLRVVCSGGMGGVLIRYPNRWERRRLRRS